jgi:alkaline phosphatase D
MVRNTLSVPICQEKQWLPYASIGTPTTATRNGWELPLANFTVAAGANHPTRPIAGGKVEARALSSGIGNTHATNLTLDTNTGKWGVVGFETMFLAIK